MKDVFKTYHPLINFTYFCAVILLGFFLITPIFSWISLTAAFFYFILLNSLRGITFGLLFLFPVTILLSLLFGTNIGIYTAAILLWISCAQALLNVDKLRYLLGRRRNFFAILLMRASYFTGSFRKQLDMITKAQACLGRGAVHIFPRYTTAFLRCCSQSRHLIKTMDARGYGHKRRINYPFYRMDDRNIGLYILILFAVLLCAGGICFRRLGPSYFPQIYHPLIDPINLVLSIAYSVLCFLPLLLSLVAKLTEMKSQPEIRRTTNNETI